MDQIRETISKAASDVQKTVAPLLEQASAATKPYVEQASAATKPYIDQASAATKPYLDQASAATKPYLDQASAALHDTAAKINTAITGEPTGTLGGVASPGAGHDVGDYKPIGPMSPVEEKKLDDALAARPSAKELQDKNILKDTKVAPGLQQAQADLEKSRIGDTLDAKIAARPNPADLEQKGILKK